MAFRDIQKMVLRRIPQSVDRLQDEGLIFIQVFYLSVAQRPSYASIKSYRLFGALFTNFASALQNRRLHQHLKTVIDLDQCSADPTSIVRSVEKLD